MGREPHQGQGRSVRPRGPNVTVRIDLWEEENGRIAVSKIRRFLDNNFDLHEYISYFSEDGIRVVKNGASKKRKERRKSMPEAEAAKAAIEKESG